MDVGAGTGGGCGHSGAGNGVGAETRVRVLGVGEDTKNNSTQKTITEFLSKISVKLKGLIRMFRIFLFFLNNNTVYSLDRKI